MTRSCAVVGGGMLGLSLALHLARAGNNVTLYEAANDPGGLAASFSWGSLTWDRHYHVILPADRALRALLDDLDLGDRDRVARARERILRERPDAPVHDEPGSSAFSGDLACR